jgi:membrane-bound ClpP family serine protease
MTVGATIILGLCVALITGMIVVVARHKKSGSRDVKLVGSVGIIDTKLDPHGTVLIQGELWPACSSAGTPFSPGCAVKVVGTQDHLLIVHHQD